MIVNFKNLTRGFFTVRRAFIAIFFLNPSDKEPSWLRNHFGFEGIEMSVSFVGGPLDGWRNLVGVKLPAYEDLTISISESLLQVCRGETVVSPTPITSVAHYALRRRTANDLEYFYVGSSRNQFVAAVFPHGFNDHIAN